MPQIFNPMKEYVINMKDDYSLDEAWELMSGRDIYRMRSITGLNRSPVETHIDFVVSDRAIEDEEQELPIDPDMIVEALIVDGSLVTLIKKDEPDKAELLEKVHIKSLDLFIQEFGMNESNEQVTREWRLTGKNWEVQDYINYGTDDQQTVGQLMRITAERVFVFPNGQGRLFRAQDTFRRLEEIELRIRKATNAAIVLVVSGFAGDRGQARDAIEKEGEHTLFMGRQATIDLVANTALADQFLMDFRNLLPRYYELMKIVNTSEAATMSGISRRLVMKPMFAYTEKLKDMTSYIYQNAFNIELNFSQTVTRTTDEINAEIDIIERMYEKQVIDLKERNTRLTALLP